MPSTVLNGRSAYEVLYRQEPDLSHLRIFGCLCFASVLPRVDKFAPRARKAVLMGYSETQKGYRLLDLENRLIFISRDITFMEHVFPFKHDSTDSPDLFFPVLDQPELLIAACDTHTSPIGATDSVPNDLPVQQEPTKVIVDYVIEQPADILEVVPADIHDEKPVITPSLNIQVREFADIRRTARSAKPPLWHKDYVLSKRTKVVCLYPIDDYITYAGMSDSYKSYVAAFSAQVEPSSFKEASTCPHWIEAMKAEV
ncbi:uncharacterized protein LOC107849410 [Capsicum annuum]|uniref:uncharacterized protein LOC107849410 n=1 Tax=Capsicum annuum TaxID=4072 RepID=UPI0007BF4DFA|nr:uncharacterized protein LOC107849410 [Capsicum annuum]